MQDAKLLVENVLSNHQKAVEGFFELHQQNIINASHALADVFAAGGKVLSCGNGGSACDAMHFAGECVGRFVNDRQAWPAMALSADPGILTAVGNDYGFDHVFARQVEAHGKQGDMLIAISTSGQSPNVLKALDVAKNMGLGTVLLTGEKGKTVPNLDYNLWVPSLITAHIQEVHITALQLMIALVENKLL